MTAPGKICPRCGTNNVEEADFCIKCGLKIRSSGESPNHESLVYLHILGSSYLLFTALLNRLVLPLFSAGSAGLIIYILLYIIPIISGFYVAYEVSRKRTNRAVIAISLWTAAMGVIGTGWLFVIGLEPGAIIGPAWLIFLASAIKTLYLIRR